MFGGLCRTVWCGVSGENGIREVLRIVNGPFLSLSLFSLLLFSNGVWFYLLFLVFPFLGCLSIVLWCLDVFAFLVHFLCTGLCFFNILLSYLSKKKKKSTHQPVKNQSIAFVMDWIGLVAILYSFFFFFFFLNYVIYDVEHCSGWEYNEHVMCQWTFV